MKPKLLFHSNAPWAPTGYGQQCALFAPMLAEHYDVAVSSFYGLEGAPIRWEGLPVFPGLGGEYGNDVLPQHAARFFGGDPRGGLVFTLMDVWVLDPAMPRELNSACWVPVDHEPAPPKVIEFFIQSDAVPIAMSRFGELALGRLDPLYVPHGVDTEVYKPMDQSSAREKSFPKGAFVVGMVAANKGRPSRKGFPQALQAFAKFAEAHDNAFLYLHTQIDPNIGGGENLPALIDRLGIPMDRIRVADQYTMLHNPYSHRDMARIFGAMDVLLNPSWGEGFGIPVLEAQACFPAGTSVQVEDPIAVQCRPYSGRMVTIETARGAFEATADHPVWTQRGWQSAGTVQPGDQVLYSHAPERMVKVHAGPIEEVARSLQHHDAGGSGGLGWDDKGIGVLGLAESGLDAQALVGIYRDEADVYDQVRASLPRGASRRRGYGDDPYDQPRAASQVELQAVGGRVQYGQTDGGLDHAACSRRLARLTNNATWHDELSVLHRGSGGATAVPSAAAVAGTQRRLAGGGNRMVGDPSIAIAAGPLDDAAARDHLADPRTEYDTVTAVSERYVRDLPVYNFTTRSGVYGVGAGYLVHNCGVPAIVTDFSAMSEVCGAGWHVKHQPYWTALNSWQAIPDGDDIVSALEECYSMKSWQRQKLSQTARKHALTYDSRLVLKHFMLPALRVAAQRFEARQPVRISPRLKAAA